MTEHPHPPLSPVATGLRARCPRCGEGKLFDGFLTPASACARCGLDFRFVDSGDGPAVFAILFAGFAVVAAALVVEVRYQPPYWLHALLWIPAVLLSTLGLLRPLKGVLIALQFRNRAAEGRLDRGEGA